MNEYNIYSCKDGRTRIYFKDSKKVVSYPRFLMEQALGRKLLPYEQVHHKDENPLNNDISNLEVKLLGKHQQDHMTKYYDKIVTCEWCKKEFVWTAKQQRRFYGNRGREKIRYTNKNPFCSKSCAAKYGRQVQLNKHVAVDQLAESADFIGAPELETL